MPSQEDTMKSIPGSIAAKAAVAVTLIGGVLFAGASAAHASVVSAPLLVPFSSSASTASQGIVMPSVDGTSVTVALTGARPNATFAVSACQSNNIIMVSTCASAPSSNTVTADGAGNINATGTLPAIQELDSIVLQDVADASDSYYAVVGPNPPQSPPVNNSLAQQSQFNPFAMLGSNTLPSAFAPVGTCPLGFTGFVSVSIVMGTFLVSCP
jgi:hypothetical protein